MNFVNFFEILKRASSGPLVSEKEFNLLVSKKLKEVVKEYDIKFDGETLVPSDDSLADDVYKAAIEFYADVGTYCMDTERIIKFTEEEIKEGLKNAPHKAFFGEGKEAKVFTPRKPESKDPPWCHVGAGISVSSEELLVKLVEGYASIPEVDSVSFPILSSIDDIPIRGPALEFYCALKTITLVQEVLRRIGRPGLPFLTLVAGASLPIVTIAVSASQFGLLKPSNGWLIPIYPELKIGDNELCKIAYLLSWGARIGTEYSPMIGGHCGGPEGAAIISVANCIQGILLGSVYEIAWMSNIIDRCSSTKDAIWASAVSCQAISRNIFLPHIQLNYQAAGPATKMLLYEVAVGVLHAIPSGASAAYPHPAKGVGVDCMTPLEMKFNVEVSHAAIGIKRTHANDIVKELLKKYEKDVKAPPEGKKYQECFDLKTNKPNEEYLRLYKEVKKELEDLGIAF